MRRMQWGSSLWPYQHHDCLPPRDLSLEGNGPPAGRHTAFTSAEGTKSPLVKHASQVNAPPLNWSSQWTLTSKHTNATRALSFLSRHKAALWKEYTSVRSPEAHLLVMFLGLACDQVTLRVTNA